MNEDSGKKKCTARKVTLVSRLTDCSSLNDVKDALRDVQLAVVKD